MPTLSHIPSHSLWVPIVLMDNFWAHWQLHISNILPYPFLHLQVLSALGETACTNGHAKILTLFCFRCALYFHTLAVMMQVYYKQSSFYPYLWAFWKCWGLNIRSNPHQQGKEMNTPTSLSLSKITSLAGLNLIAYIGNPPHLTHPLMAFLPSLAYLLTQLLQLCNPRSTQTNYFYTSPFFQGQVLRDHN